MDNLSTYIQYFKEAGPQSDFTWSASIFSELIFLARNTPTLQPLGDLKPARGKPLSFFLIDELASGHANPNIHLILPAINLLEINADKKNALHYLLTLSPKAEEQIESATTILMMSPQKLELPNGLRQQAVLSPTMKLTVLEYAAFMKCQNNIYTFLEIVKKTYPQEIAAILNDTNHEGKSLGDLLVARSVDVERLSACGWIKK